MRFILQTIVTALALWITTLLVPGITVTPYADGAMAAVLTFLLVAVIFGLVNSTIGLAIKIVSIPLYLLTLGLVSFLINGLLLMLAAWFTQLLGFGLAVEGFWWGVWGAIILGLASWFIGLFVRPASHTRNV
ncbi:MAG: phage holin family protein [Microbacteriaceae bacterium]